jgi:hypothetical protein
MQEAKYHPEDVHYFVDIKPDIMRDRRRRGETTYFGTKSENGRWKFSGSDLIGLAVTEKVMRQLNDLFEAERVANWCKGEVAKHLGLVERHPDYIEILPKDVIGANAVQNMDRGFMYCLFALGRNPVFTDNPSEVHDMDVHTALILDLRHIAKTMNPELVSELMNPQRRA